MPGYDVIGDIHGHADPLKRLLAAMGYVPERGAYRHPTRIAIFLGDLIDRGPQQRAVLHIVRRMVDAGSALAVMGNHEFNAVRYATPDGEGGFLRSHTAKNRAQHRAFLEQIGEGSPAHADALAWFKTLPLWLDLDGLRAVHACWNANAQQALGPYLDNRRRLTDRGFAAASKVGSDAYEAGGILLMGPETSLPNGHAFHDKDGFLRRKMRLRWWDPSAATFRSAAINMEGHEHELPDDPIAVNFAYRDSQPVLFGHYWLQGSPSLLHPYASCLDFSVACGGCLAAYRWSGEPKLAAENLTFVPA